MPFKAVEPKPNFSKLEEEILAFWEKEKIFEKSLEQTRPKVSPPREGETKRGLTSPSPSSRGGEFTFYDGPPFATGLPHYGHILASTIKDVIPRYQTMKGRYVRRRWGWDCHGLPIEEIVERQLKISGKKQIEEIGIKKFNETCRSKVLEYVGEWRKTVRRIARWVDFDNSYKTMDRDYMESVWWAFKQIYDKELVYEGRKVLLYCPRCETPVSNFEVAMDNSYKDVTEEAVTVKFRIKKDSVIASVLAKQPARLAPRTQVQAGGSRDRHDSAESRDDKNRDTYFLAWTTTPWTLPANIGLAVGRDIEYVKVRVGEEFYIVSKDRVNAVIASGTPRGNPNEIASASTPRNNEIVKGSDLVGLEYVPLFEVPEMKSSKSYRVYAGDFVNTEEGTGIVHISATYGEDDHQLALQEKIPIVPLLDEKGQFNDQAPELIRGQYFKDSEKVIKKDLDDRGLIFERKSYLHSYPHCWRCGTALYYNAIPAWFINIQKIKKKLLKSNDKEINWFPEHLKHGRYEKSVEAAPDWNISRNRYWGNPIPVWRCAVCKKDTVIGSVAELKEKAINGIEPLLVRRGRGGYSDSITPSNSPSRGGGPDLDLHRPYIDEVILKCDHCGGEARRITEIFDSWVEAGSMPFASVHYPFSDSVIASPDSLSSLRGTPKQPQSNNDEIASPSEYKGFAMTENSTPRDDRFILPAQFVTEYIAQTRAWFYVMHIISIILFGKAPFENVLTTGTLMAEDGNKLSKSKRNFPDPWEVIEKYGVDSLRFYLMNSVVMQADNQNFSEKDLATTHRKVVLILWNVYNYFVAYANSNPVISFSRHAEGNPEASQDNTKRFFGVPQNDNSIANENILDQWMLAKLQELINSVTENLDNYDTVHTTREIEVFINDLSTWYLRRSRGRSDEAFLQTLRHVLLELSKVMAPFAPYMSEEIFRNLVIASEAKQSRDRRGEGTPRDDSIILSVHLASWPEAKKLTKDQEGLLAQMSELRKIVEEVHALRAKAGIKLRQPLKKLVIPTSVILRYSEGSRDSSAGTPQNDGPLLEILKSEVNVKEVIFGDKLELETVLDESLKLEGLTAELTRQIQQFRKDSGLRIGEMAELYFDTTSAILESAIEQVDLKKVYVSKISKIKDQKSKLNIEKELNIEGEKIVLKF